MGAFPGPNFRGLPWAAVLLVASAACASTGSVAELRTEVRTLAARQDSILAELRASVLNQHGTAMDSLAALADQIFAHRGSTNNVLTGIRDEQLRLSEVVGTSERRMDQLERDFEDRLRRVESRLQAPPAAADTAGAPAAERPDTVLPDATAPDRALYRAAVGNFERDLRTSARLGFTQLIETYPRSQLAPAAYLHLGELLTLDGELSAAVETYLEIRKLYPTAGEVAAALYRAGELCIRLEEYERAREYLERVINTYPDDWFADQARNKLEEIP